MTDRTEEDIKKMWVEKESGPKVSVECNTYNQVQYISRAIDSFLMQDTDFPFEIIIHDDASTDGTSQIVKEYAQRFPSIVVPIIEVQNQYSNLESPFWDNILPRIRGKYIALCEGDDYWCSKTKLQKQWEFMEMHPRCSMVVHNTKIHDLSEQNPDHLFFEEEEVWKLTEEDIFLDWKVHTSSYFMKKEDFYKVQDLTFSRNGKRYWFGDYRILCFMALQGDIFVLPEVLSVYNYGVQNGVTQSNNKTKLRNVEKELIRIEFLRQFDVYSNHRFHSVIEKRISAINYDAISVYLHSSIVENDKGRRMEFVQLIDENPNKKDYFLRGSLLKRLQKKISYLFCKYCGVFIYL